MSGPIFRPTFSLHTAMTDAEFAAQTQSLIDEQSDRIEGQVARDHALVTFVESERHFWSPWLHLELRKINAQRRVYGRFSPHPSIWTAFMFSYLSLAVISFFAAIIGTAQRMAGESTWAFWAIPCCIAMAIALWLASRTGQKLAHDQMDEMTKLIRDWNSNSR